MRVIGLTGGIASGKSLVSERLAERGAAVIDADKVGHESYRSGTGTFDAVVEAFGKEVVGADGEIDRKALGGKVFGDPEARRRLEAIVWPAIRTLIGAELDRLRAQGERVAVVEAAVLIEADWVPLVDEVWLVTAQRETAIARLAERNGMSEEQAQARIDAQLSNEERRAHADIVIENDGTLEELDRAIEGAWAKLVNGVAG